MRLIGVRLQQVDIKVSDSLFEDEVKDVNVRMECAGDDSRSDAKKKPS